MASSGIRRKVDDLGRVVIPVGIRRALNIREGDAVEVTVDGERIVLARPRDACVFCGQEDGELTTYRSRRVCADCLRSLASLDDPGAASPSFPDTGHTPADPATPAATRPARPRPARRPRQVEPARTGPIDGDELTKAAARSDTADREDDDAPARARPPYDPSSTTAW